MHVNAPLAAEDYVQVTSDDQEATCFGNDHLMMHADARSARLVTRLGLIRGIQVMFSPGDSVTSEEISFELASTTSPEGVVT
eukprot:14805184-Heterocapsa_arctica.AAC.1